MTIEYANEQMNDSGDLFIVVKVCVKSPTIFSITE